jgi:hypothetical protein
MIRKVLFLLASERHQELLNVDLYKDVVQAWQFKGDSRTFSGSHLKSFEAADSEAGGGN